MAEVFQTCLCIHKSKIVKYVLIDGLKIHNPMKADINMIKLHLVLMG